MLQQVVSLCISVQDLTRTGINHTLSPCPTQKDRGEGEIISNIKLGPLDLIQTHSLAAA